MKKLIRFIESANFVYATTLSLLAVQIMQTAHLFHRVSRLDLSLDVAGWNITVFGWLHSLCCTFAIEAAVLMLIVNGRKVAARWYALASLLCSLLYFGDWELLVYGGWEPLLPRLVATSLFSAMLAGSVLFFSELFTGKMLEQKASEQKATQAKASEQKAAEAKAIEQKAAEQKPPASKSGKQMASAAGGIALLVGGNLHGNGNGHAAPALPADAMATPWAFACRVCGRGFATIQALNAHSRKHQ